MLLREIAEIRLIFFIIHNQRILNFPRFIIKIYIIIIKMIFLDKLYIDLMYMLPFHRGCLVLSI